MGRPYRQARRGKHIASPTIKQVAARAGVSTATVSRVLAGADRVSDSLRARVSDAVRELDYYPNHIARNLRARATRTIGVVISDIQNPFFTSVIGGIESVLLAANYVLLLGNSDELPEREQLYLATLRSEGVAGIIFASSTVETGVYQPFLKAKVPLVAIDRTPPGLDCDSVAAANIAGARAAGAHLIRLGHRKIGFISGPRQFSTARERQVGYEQALVAARIAISDDLTRYADYRQPGGYAAMLELLNLAEPPTAVFVANNLMTLGALQAIHERGLRIPADIAVVSFDDMPWATSLQPPLTAVAQPTYEMGATAARLLLARLREPDRPVQHVVLETQLMVRASCGSPGAALGRKPPATRGKLSVAS